MESSNQSAVGTVYSIRKVRTAISIVLCERFSNPPSSGLVLVVLGKARPPTLLAIPSQLDDFIQTTQSSSQNKIKAVTGIFPLYQRKGFPIRADRPGLSIGF